MRGYNRAIIAGNLTRDPDVRRTVNKRAYARFAVAVNRQYKDTNGEYKELTDYINVVVWGPMAENCEKYLKKGSPVLVDGRIQTSSYDAKDGSGKKYMTEINAENVLFLGSGQQNQNQNSGGGSYSRTSAPQEWPDMEIPSDDDFGKPLSEVGFFAGTSDRQQSSNDLASKMDYSNIDEHTIPF